MHERLREAGPVAYIPKHGHYAYARHAEVIAALKDWRTYSSAAGVGLQDPREPGYFRGPGLLLEQDPPEHTKYRAVFNPVLSAPSVRKLRKAASEAAVRLVNSLVQRGMVDGVADLAQVYSLQVLPDAVGMPVQGREHLLPYGDLAFNGIGSPNELFARALERSQVAQEWVTETMKRGSLSDAGMGAKIYASADAGVITEEEAGLLVRNFLAAGIDTVVSSLAGAVHLLAGNPEQWAKLHCGSPRFRPRRALLPGPDYRAVAR